MVHTLKPSDFKVVTTNDKKKVVLTRPGRWVVFFAGRACPACTEFSKVYSTLPMTEPGDTGVVNYAICYLTKELTDKMSGSTTTISVVPHFILYSDNRPALTYTGKRDIERIRQFARTSAVPKKAAPKARETRPPSVHQNMNNEYYPEGYNTSKPDTGNYLGRGLTLPRNIRPWNEPFQYNKI